MTVTIIKKPAFDSGLTKAGTKAKDLQELVHSLCMYAADQLIQHRNVDPFHKIFELPGSINHKGIAQWIVEFLPADVSNGKVTVKGAKTLPYLAALDAKPAILERANETPFYELHTGSNISAKATNFQADLEALLARAMAMERVGNPDKAVGIELMKSIVAALPDAIREDIDARAAANVKRLETVKSKQAT